MCQLEQICCPNHVFSMSTRINSLIRPTPGMKLEACQPLTMLHAERYEMQGAWTHIAGPAYW